MEHEHICLSGPRTVNASPRCSETSSSATPPNGTSAFRTQSCSCCFLTVAHSALSFPSLLRKTTVEAQWTTARRSEEPGSSFERPMSPATNTSCARRASLSSDTRAVTTSTSALLVGRSFGCSTCRTLARKVRKRDTGWTASQSRFPRRRQMQERILSETYPPAR